MAQLGIDVARKRYGSVGDATKYYSVRDSFDKV